ncbi:hypothetical protein [Haloglomus salinum]|jgi:hypothetical protein|uniref:hypothetical protein n=1 Tax=Haloglomus salinum TaxID=2962673 RepID=UPI0020C9ADDB|nr:hypothetical protein [Haloglomus salinum]
MSPDRQGVERSERRRRSVRQLLFVIAGSHTGAFLGSVIPSSRLGIPGDVFSVLLIVVLFTLPFVVDSNWERIDGWYQDRLE